jgi:hypothetical protein
MGHRCRDDFWLWATLVVAATNDDSHRSSCCCDERHDYRSDFDSSYRAERPATHAKDNVRASLLVVAAMGLILLLVVIAINSITNDARPIKPAPLNLAFTPTETPSEAPAEPVSAPAVEPTQPLDEPAPIAEAEPAPIQVANLVAPVAAVPSLESNDLDSLFFDVGSSRAEVIAAQGRPPTYVAHHDRSLWWGSSRVAFDRDGRVRSWVDGTPALNVYRR